MKKKNNSAAVGQGPSSPSRDAHAVLIAQLCQLFPTPWTVAHQAPLSMGFSRKNAGVGSLSLLQGIFPTQGLNPGLLHCRQIPYHLNHQASPRKLGWVAYPFSRGSSQPRDRTRVSCIAGGFFKYFDKKNNANIYYRGTKARNKNLDLNIKQRKTLCARKSSRNIVFWDRT